MLAALGSHGGEAVMTLDGAPAAEVVRGCVAQVLGPTLRPGAIVVMDHRRAPKTAGMRAAVAQVGAQGLSWPPSSPAVSPLAPCWSPLKPAWHTATARTRAALERAIAQARATMTVADAHSWCPHCGYPLH